MKPHAGAKVEGAHCTASEARASPLRWHSPPISSMCVGCVRVHACVVLMCVSVCVIGQVLMSWVALGFSFLVSSPPPQQIQPCLSKPRRSGPTMRKKTRNFKRSKRSGLPFVRACFMRACVRACVCTRQWACSKGFTCLNLLDLLFFFFPL